MNENIETPCQTDGSQASSAARRSVVQWALRHEAAPFFVFVLVIVGIVVGVNEFAAYVKRPATAARLAESLAEHPGCLLRQLPHHFDSAGTLVRPISNLALNESAHACADQRQAELEHDLAVKAQRAALASAPLPAAPKR